MRLRQKTGLVSRTAARKFSLQVLSSLGPLTEVLSSLSYAIFPSHFSTPLPTNCRDEDLAEGNLIVRPLEEPTISTKLILSIRVASCIRRFFEVR